MLFTIQDNGVGIPDEDLPYIFDPFFTTKAVGVGMGLCRARQIIAEHKGDLRIDGVQGIGTKVLIRIPRTVDSCAAAKSEAILKMTDENPPPARR